ncbi:MAG: hypothetical protein WC763_07510 [Candidatus Paceibacterota bacterium]|jgi:hypothetical protein
MRKIKLIQALFLRHEQMIREWCSVDIRGEEVTCIHCEQVACYLSDIPFNHLWDQARKLEVVVHHLEHARSLSRHLENPATTERCLREFARSGPALKELTSVCSNPSCPPDILRQWWKLCKNSHNNFRVAIKDAILRNSALNILSLEMPGEHWIQDVISVRAEMEDYALCQRSTGSILPKLFLV